MNEIDDTNAGTPKMREDVTEFHNSNDDILDSVFSNSELLNSLVTNKKWSEISSVLEKISQALLIRDNRKRINVELVESLSEVLSVAADNLKAAVSRDSINLKREEGQDVKPCEEMDIAVVIIETFRALRNSCVNEPRTQKVITEKSRAVEATCGILKTVSSLPDNQYSNICSRVGTQFLGNLVVNNKDTQPIIWNKCSQILIDLLKCEDEKTANYSSMVLYNILLGCPDISNTVEDYKELLQILIEHAMKDSEFALFTIELLLSKKGYLPKVYNKIDTKHRLFLLDVLHSTISEDCKTSIPVCSLKFLSETFKSHSDCILKTCEKYVEGLEPVEVSKLLQILASAAANSKYRLDLQEDTSLLITCSMLLLSMHSLGKSGSNNFSIVQKMAELSVSAQSADITEHPAFGFKSHLVQILGNLCWRHQKNQDQIRELDCIPVLLDCCNIDARNPLIIQWIVLAVRNLCEKNLKNQSVIAAMTRQGTVDSSVLHEMGLTLHADDENKIVLLPLKRDTNP